MKPTADPTCWVDGEGDLNGTPYVVYANKEGERWVIRGRCIACGECEVGAVNENLVWTGIPVGEAGACLDRTFGLKERLDVPVRPELTTTMPHCTLTGEYLHGD